MANPSTLIVFGSSPESFYIGHGRRHFIENMPQSFTTHAQTDLNISMTLWISVSRSLEVWVSYNVPNSQYHFPASINQAIRDHLGGTDAAQYVSFPDSTNPGAYFAKGKNAGAWNGVLDNFFVTQIKEYKADMPNFDARLKGMIFGKGKTFLCLLDSGFRGYLDENEIVGDHHPLRKVLQQHMDGWTLEIGSTLCFYDSRYFVLYFKRPGQSGMTMHWNLPPTMAQKLHALEEAAKQPEEQIALMQESQMWQQVVQNRMNAEMQMSLMFQNSIRGTVLR
ncbi:hypothetical protein MVEN_01432300 [Mycena venus]|uniref:Uncharacterized protein n=1 Tax=Mycena venus TaxID=2733690 RepID=A0A8H6XZF9_9AGAR|nr:hypothetical protein MVEN_01432300 [Mycena venus]